MGATFGSFFTLAVHRIPLREDITHTRSYCPKCNHKLGFWDMIPILSYTFLGGRCRYCKTTIRARYILLEILSGILFVFFALSIKFSLYTMNIPSISYIIMGIIYISTLVIIAGIDKEKIKVEKPVLLFGFICIAIYMIYLYIVEKNLSIYRYVIYLILVCALTIMDTIYLRKKAKTNYTIDVLLLSLYMIMFSYEIIYIWTVIITLFAIAIQLFIRGFKSKKSKYVKTKSKFDAKIPIAFYLCVSNILMLIVNNIFVFYG